MTIVASKFYRSGKPVQDVALGEQVSFEEGEAGFVWIGIVDPEPKEIEALQKTYDLHPLAVEDALKANQIPKVDVYGDQLFVVARSALLVDDEFCYGQTAIFVGRHHVISVRHGCSPPHKGLRAHLEAAPSLLNHGTDYVLHGILDFIVDGYLPMIEAVEDEVLSMEQQSLDSFLDREQINRIFRLRRDLIRFGRVLGPMTEVASKLVRLDLPCIDPDARPYFSDVLDHVRRVQSMTDALREVLSSVFEFSNLLEQQRTGTITRQLAAWAAILAVPTAIAGVYGMNFENMPELRTHNGYFVVLGVIGVLCTALYVKFRQSKWL
jgi:magnesium transporter